MFTNSDLFITALLFTGFGIAIGLMAAFWKPRRPSIEEGTAFRQSTPFYASWPPDCVVLTEFKTYNNRAEWAREKGLV